MTGDHEKKPVWRRGISALFAGSAVVAGITGYAWLTEEKRTPEKPASPPAAAVVKPAVVEAAAPVQPYVSPEAGKALSSRSLTAGEENLARTLFGDKLDVDGVRLGFFRSDGGKLLSNVEPGETKNIEFFGKSRQSDDFSQEKDVRRYGAFVEELTRLWQNQTQGDWTRGSPKATLYALDDDERFEDYGATQQAEIMEDYALRFLHPSRQSRWLHQEYGGDRTDTDPWLQRLVEDFSPAAEKARLAFADVETRPLTAGEQQLIHSIFGGQLDTSEVRESFYPEAYEDAAATTVSGESSDFWGGEQKSADFSREKDADRFAYFVHEMTHVWQFQAGYRYTDNFVGEADETNPLAAYLYPLDAVHKFTDYGVEQQAAIIEDYARFYLHADGELRYLPQTYPGEELAEKLPLLQKVVEDQFPAARQARLDFAAKHPQTPAPAAFQIGTNKPAFKPG